MSDNLNKITKYLEKRTTLTLSCVSDGKPWCCNCFYLFDSNSVSFIITSDVTTRHGQMMIAHPYVAGTITEQPTFIGKIKGVQYNGTIRLLSGQDELNARQRFCQRYPVAKVIKAPMWEIQIDELKMTDNTLGFASKIIWLK